MSLPSRCRGGGQYKMYNSLIFINFICRSKNVKPKSKSCIKHLFTVNKLLGLWYFVSVLNLKFLDQLERRHCKETPFFRPFYIRAPKGPFLRGLRRNPPCHLSYLLTMYCAAIFEQNLTINLHPMQSLQEYHNCMLLTVYFRSGGKSIESTIHLSWVRH